MSLTNGHGRHSSKLAAPIPHIVHLCSLHRDKPRRLARPPPFPVRSRLIGKTQHLQLPGAAAAPSRLPHPLRTIMAPVSARRAVPRIVPAIPHRLSRAPPPARPITPEESNKGTVAQQEPDPAPKTAEERQSDGPPEEHLLTPDSRASVAGKSAAGAPALVHSPPSSQVDAQETPADAPGTLPLRLAPPLRDGAD